MTPTEMARRSDSLYMDTKNMHRRQLCDMVAHRENDIEDLKDEAYGLRCDIGRLETENAHLRDELDAVGTAAYLYGRSDLKAENAKLREQVEHLQPKDCEGNVLDIADTVSMLRSEYDGDHEWDDVVVELALTKWGGDRWIVRGSKGEAWACDCSKTGYDEDAYEGSDDVEPIDNPTLIEAENAKLRELCGEMLLYIVYPYICVSPSVLVERARELGIEVEE